MQFVQKRRFAFLGVFLFIITYMSEQLFPEYVAFTDGIGGCEELCGQKTCQCYTCRRDRGTTNVGAPKRKIQIRPVHVDEKYIVISLCLRREERYVQVEQMIAQMNTIHKPQKRF